MKTTLRNLKNSPKFMAGFIIFLAIFLLMMIYPVINPGSPLERIGVGTFSKPGIYFSMYDAASTEKQTFRLADADDKRLVSKLTMEDRVEMIEWFGLAEIDVSDLKMEDTEKLLQLWEENYDPSKVKMTQAKKKKFKRLNANLESLKAADSLSVMQKNAESGELEEVSKIEKTDYINVTDVTNTKFLPLGTDNFGRDVLKELASAARTSILIGIIAGVVATVIGLFMGLLAGYIGGIVDDIISFITNIFTVIPSFVLLILISYSLSQDQRGPSTVAIVIGFTSWTWTARSVRSQVISLRNRDHVNLSKLSGHSLFRIIMTDILPYIASYVVMAFILQVSSGILAESQLSLLGLGPKTTEVPTLGLMMNWAMLYSAHLNGSWWAYFPVILMIALISFSLNLMNTALDQIFNPTLRD